MKRATPAPTPTRKKTALAAGLVVLLAAGIFVLWHFRVLGVLSHSDRLVRWLRAPGARGALLCIAAQFIQVVIFAIPGEIVQFAVGYVFGIWKGAAYSVAGIMLGTAFNFYFAQLVGRPVVARLIGNATLEKVDRLLNSTRGKSAIFLLFLLPGTPKDAMCYGAGLSDLNLWEFVVISNVARFPSLMASLVLGAQASHRDYEAMVLTGVAMAAAVLGYYLYKRRQQKLPRDASAGDG
jgi:uncharacterized membrane protein YdjX (TVP38/TMEM64 family)